MCFLNGEVSISIPVLAASTGATSPYVVYLQGGAFVTHGDRAEHHFPEHVDVGSWSRVLCPRNRSQLEHNMEQRN